MAHGLPIQIGLASRSHQVQPEELLRVAAALAQQVSRDFTPLWGVHAIVTPLPNPDSIEPGVWPITIEDHLDVDAAGFHLTRDHQPYAAVEAGPSWSLTASHECLEMLADPSGSRLHASTGIALVGGAFQDVHDQKVEYLVEICDPCQDEANAYMVGGVLVADFITPHYFDPQAVAAVRYSYSGRVIRPREVLPGGYLSWRDPGGNGFQQAAWDGVPSIRHIDPGPAPLRETIDRAAPRRPLSALPPGSAPMTLMRSRAAYLDQVSPARAALYAAGRRTGLAQLLRPGVLFARPGFLVRDNWVQNIPAHVVVTRPEAVEAVRQVLPPTLDGMPVDVRAASPGEMLAADQPLLFARTGATRHEYREPEFPGTVHALSQNPPAAVLEASRPAKPQLPYERPAGVSLDPITADMELTLCASPDAGWAVLEPFLAASPKQTLVVGMYDFTAPHIQAALLQGAADLTLTLDHPAGKATREQTIDTTEAELATKLKRHLHFAWALENSDPKAAAWVFPNAYHIKVAVRADDRMWLSSGNWNTTNQPQIDLGDKAAAAVIAAKSDRDWHVVAQSPELSAVFRAFLAKDFDTARQHQAAEIATAAGSATPMVPDALVALEAAARVPTTWFPARTLRGRFTVRPLLTPLDYQPHVLALIQGATQRFYMQTQYIHPSGRPGDEDHDALIAAVATLITRGIDVRLITSQFQNAAWIEKVMQAGIDSRVLRIQQRVHNKGIVVDGARVLVSSQNWSADGTLRNRDAGLLIESTEAAAYFEQIFLHDWAHLAAQSL